MHKVFLFLLLIFIPFQIIVSQNQENVPTEDTIHSKFKLDFGSDIVSRYMWRGLNLSESPCIQPYFEYSYKQFVIGSWASYSFSKEPLQEVDLYLKYTNKLLSLTIFDYFNPVDTLGYKDDFLLWDKKTTRHCLEAILEVEGPERFPVSIEAGLMFFGNDRDTIGNNLFSNYLELKYSSQLQEYEIQPFIGFTFTEGIYEKPGVVHFGFKASRSLSISEKFELPVNICFGFNPQQQRVYFVFACSL